MGKVAIGKARYLLNIVFIHLDVRIISFPKILIIFNKKKTTNNKLYFEIFSKKKTKSIV